LTRATHRAAAHLGTGQAQRDIKGGGGNGLEEEAEEYCNTVELE
jgi:hypothetical protein